MNCLPHDLSLGPESVDQGVKLNDQGKHEEGKPKSGEQKLLVVRKYQPEP